MTNIIQPATTSTVLLSRGDYWYLPADAGVLVADGWGVYVTGSAGQSNFTVDGTVVSLYDDALITVSFADSPLSLVVGETGVMRGNPNSTSSFGAYVSGSIVAVLSEGEISGGRGLGVQTNNFASIQNGGLMHGTMFGGLTIDGAGVVSIDNTGEIGGRFFGIETIYDNVLVTVRNSGLITATSDGGYAIWGPEIGGALQVRNTGVIRGDYAAIQSAAGADLVVNGGVIEGDVVLGAGADRVRNQGEIWGDVDLGLGIDLYRAGPDGHVDGRILAGSSNDTVIGGHGADTVDGGDGDDVLRGMAGDDELRGGAGAETITGGLGDDAMWGGGQADVFRIGSVSGDDVVMDFQNDLDRIDLSRLSILGANKVGTVQAAAHNVSGGSLIDLSELGGEGSLEIRGLTTAQYSSADFIF